MKSIIILFLLCVSCDCNNKPVPPNHNEVRQLGTVITNGEACKIDEVVEISYIRFTCIDEISKSEKSLVRRIICPSGNNGQSTVTDDGTKFHREVLQ
jgi:hypothetical protein